jgi:hypothetical protein
VDLTAVCLLTRLPQKKKSKKRGGGVSSAQPIELIDKGGCFEINKKKMPFGQRMPRKQAADGVCGISVIYKYN